ncbi:reverse transcriptase domain-containing protein, partial [Tanacetum coccineum]
TQISGLVEMIGKCEREGGMGFWPGETVYGDELARHFLRGSSPFLATSSPPYQGTLPLSASPGNEERHGFAAIYFLHRDPEAYVSEWYTKERFVSSYNHYIKGMNGMNQWPITSYQKPLPPIKRRMPGRPPHKRKIDFSKKDGNMSRISRKGQVNHCTLCGASGHNQRACPSKGLDGSATSVNPPPMSARGGKRSAKGGKTPSVSSRPSSPSVGFEMSTPTSPSLAVRLRGGVYIKGNSPIKASSTESRGRGLMTSNGKVVRS